MQSLFGSGFVDAFRNADSAGSAIPVNVGVGLGYFVAMLTERLRCSTGSFLRLFVFPPSGKHLEALTALPTSDFCNPGVFWSKLMATLAMCFRRAGVRLSGNECPHFPEVIALSSPSGPRANKALLTRWCYAEAPNHIGMAIGASLFFIRRMSAMLRSRANQKVIRINAVPAMACVMAIVLWWNWSNEAFVCDSVSQSHLALFVGDHSVTGKAFTSEPRPAFLLGSDLCFLVKTVNHWFGWASSSHVYFGVNMNYAVKLMQTPHYVNT